MTTVIRKAVIVYFSPAGSTAHIARIIQNSLTALETPVVTLDLGAEPRVPFIIPQ
jgi:flavodoxin